MTDSRSTVGAGPGEVTGPVLPPRDRGAGRTRTGSALPGSVGFVALLLDDLVRIPGTRQGVGLDAVVGLVPGVGDIAGAGLSSVILLEALRQRIPLPVLARMGFNLLVDAALGYLPVVGDLADVAHRANRRNLALFRQVVDDPGRARDESAGYLLRAGLLVALTLLAVIASAVFMVWLVVNGLRSLG